MLNDMAEALAQGADTVMTQGATQSNHALMSSVMHDFHADKMRSVARHEGQNAQQRIRVTHLKGLRAQVQSSSVLAQMNAVIAGAGIGVIHHFLLCRRNSQNCVTRLAEGSSD